MASTFSDDILVRADSAGAGRPSRARFAAFLPITLAVAGVTVMLLGGVSARHVPVAEAQAVDPIATGSIAQPAEAGLVARPR